MTSPAHREILFIANREVRVIPKGWRHPKRHGRFVPLLPDGYVFEDADRRPKMPATAGLGPEETEIAAYETTTEGTPISPASPNTPEGKLALVNHCVKNATVFGAHTADGKAWAAALFGEAVVASEGRVRAG
ncbi:MAG: hypothetical protein ACYC9X_11925 [Dehalococcoidia bacterium]